MSVPSFRHLTYNNENNILSFYRDSDDLVLAFPQNEGVASIYNATHDEKTWSRWIDSAGKADKTPDFYCDSLQMMMEVMRFDDKAYKKGKKNPSLERESEMLKELENSGMLESFPNLQHIQLNSVTELPTDEDHNFCRYRDNFVRVLVSHSRQTSTYRKNHPGYVLIFFVFDETSGVYHRKISTTQVQHHFYWADSVIVKAIAESKADFLIWFKPYNAYETLEGMKNDLPKIIIYDIANMKIEPIDYCAEQMISSEI